MVALLPAYSSQIFYLQAKIFTSIDWMSVSLDELLQELKLCLNFILPQALGNVEVSLGNYCCSWQAEPVDSLHQLTKAYLNLWTGSGKITLS